MECLICYNSTSNLIQCEYCNHQYCKQCCEKYLLTSNDINCMNCKQTWTLLFIIQKLGNGFVNNKLKNHRENVLLNKEKRTLNELQYIAENERKRKKEKVEIKKIESQIVEYQQQILKCKETIYNIKIGQQHEDYSYKYTNRKCQNENCKGILDVNNKCNICEKITCTICNEIKEINHECKKEVVDTMNLINNKYKKCPICHIHIEKKDGCNQMWCTNCKNGFHWITGIRETGEIHNPHYIEYIQKEGIDIEEQVHIGIIAWKDILDDINKYTYEIQNKLYGYYQIILHIEHILLVKYQNYRDNTDIKVKYLLNDISEKKYKQMLHKIEKEKWKKDEIYKILDDYCYKGKNIYNNFYNYNDIYKIVQELYELSNEYNKKSLILSKCFKNKIPYICMHSLKMHST